MPDDGSFFLSESRKAGSPVLLDGLSHSDLQRPRSRKSFREDCFQVLGERSVFFCWRENDDVAKGLVLWGRGEEVLQGMELDLVVVESGVAGIDFDGTEEGIDMCLLPVDRLERESMRLCQGEQIAGKPFERKPFE